MIKYQCCEPDCEGMYTQSDLLELWENEIDKTNFDSFKCWLADMLKMGILIEEK